jgi:hypothetical protein
MASRAPLQPNDHSLGSMSVLGSMSSIVRTWICRTKTRSTPHAPVASSPSPNDITDDQIWLRIVKVIEQQRRDSNHP